MHEVLRSQEYLGSNVSNIFHAFPDYQSRLRSVQSEVHLFLRYHGRFPFILFFHCIQYWTYSHYLMWPITLNLKCRFIKELKVTQSCLTRCDRMDCRVHGILQARMLEWVAILFSWVREPRSRPGFNPWVGNIPWRREWLPTLVFWPHQRKERQKYLGQE